MIFGILTKALEIRCVVIKAYFVYNEMGLKLNPTEYKIE